MLKSTRFLTGSAAALMLVSCGPSAKPDPSPSSVVSEPAMSDSGPLSAAEMAMKEKMAGAIGANVSDTWLAQMIEHHRGAIEMSRIVLEQNPSNMVRKMAQDTITNQGKEIGDLTKLRSNGTVDRASVTPYEPATMQMHQAMMAAAGADISEAYLSKMLAHHRGAIAMSDIVIAQGTDPKVRAAAEKTKTVQANEAAMVERMLTSKSMSMAVPMEREATPQTRASDGQSKLSPSPSATAASTKMGNMSNMKM